jgi:hypothetical protein
VWGGFGMRLHTDPRAAVQSTSGGILGKGKGHPRRGHEGLEEE